MLLCMDSIPWLREYVRTASSCVATQSIFWSVLFIVVTMGLYFCDFMALGGVRRVMSTAHARYRRVLLSLCMNLFPSLLSISVVSGSVVYCTLEL